MAGQLISMQWSELLTNVGSGEFNDLLTLLANELFKDERKWTLYYSGKFSIKYLSYNLSDARNLWSSNNESQG